MTCSASLIGSLLPLVAAVAPLAPPPTAPAAIEARVVARVAGMWAVPADRVRLTWGRVPSAVREVPEAPVELVGRGTDGWFAVVLRPDGGEPLAARVRAGVVRPVAVAARALVSGVVLGDGDVRLEERLAWGPPRTETPAGAGWTVRRPLAAGESLEWPAVAPPALIEAGTPVTLVWARGAVSVSRPGVALNAARAGGTVHVRADGGGRLRGIATGPGTVTLTDGGRP